MTVKHHAAMLLPPKKMVRLAQTLAACVWFCAIATFVLADISWSAPRAVNTHIFALSDPDKVLSPSGKLHDRSDGGRPESQFRIERVEDAGDAPIYHIRVADDPDRVLNIQNGDPAFSSIPSDWWSGHWVMKQQGTGFELGNRWKPSLRLAVRDDGALGVVGAGNGAALWGFSSLPSGLSSYDDPKPTDKAAEALVDPIEVSQLPASAALLDAPLRGSQGSLLELSSATETAQTWNQSQLESRKPELPQTQEISEVHAPQEPKLRKSRTVPKDVQHTEKEEKGFNLGKIKGVFSANNDATAEVGPTQTYLKLFTENLFKPGDVFWVLLDGFSLGEELYALRGGFQTPISQKHKWYLRYGFNWANIKPFPIDNDFISLDITELDHKLEIYKIFGGEGYFNETGVSLAYLDSNQTKLELDGVVPRDLSFTGTEIGVYTTGAWWRETETKRQRLNYRFSLEQGVSLFSASDAFEVRTEAEAFPLVFRGSADFRHEWKETRRYVLAKAAVHYADRATEWHEHIALGGANFASGFDAAEAAGEIGIGASVEFGKRYDTKLTAFDHTWDLMLTPFVKGELAAIESRVDLVGDGLEYARDTALGSASIGLHTKLDAWSLSLAYGLPVFGESRFENGRDGRLSVTTTVTW